MRYRFNLKQCVHQENAAPFKGYDGLMVVQDYFRGLNQPKTKLFIGALMHTDSDQLFW
jgi:hypothetical protein